MTICIQGILCVILIELGKFKLKRWISKNRNFLRDSYKDGLGNFKCLSNVLWGTLVVNNEKPRVLKVAKV